MASDAKVVKKQRAKSRGETPMQGFAALDPSKGLFAMNANATHHFFNNRAFHPTHSNDRSLQTVNDGLNSTKLSSRDQNLETEDNAISTSRRLKSKRRTHTTQNLNYKQDFTSNDFNSTGMTYPNLPLKNKIAEKSRKRQLAVKA